MAGHITEPSGLLIKGVLGVTLEEPALEWLRSQLLLVHRVESLGGAGVHEGVGLGENLGDNLAWALVLKAVPTEVPGRRVLQVP